MVDGFDHLWPILIHVYIHSQLSQIGLKLTCCEYDMRLRGRFRRFERDGVKEGADCLIVEFLLVVCCIANLLLMTFPKLVLTSIMLSSV